MANPGKHIHSVANKNDTFTVEGINADLRHYRPESEMPFGLADFLGAQVSAPSPKKS